MTIVSRERWKAVAEALGQHVDPVLRRANLLISGVDLENSRGNILRVGSGRLRVNGETRPCERMDAQLPGWRAERRHRWGGGVYASVLADGKIAVGDPVEGERAAPRNRRARASRGVETCQKPSSLGSVLVLLQLRLSLCKAPPRRNGATIQRYVRRHEYLLTPLDRGAPWNSTTVDG